LKTPNTLCGRPTTGCGLATHRAYHYQPSAPPNYYPFSTRLIIEATFSMMIFNVIFKPFAAWFIYRLLQKRQVEAESL
jgi:hypothetical protein